MIHIFPVTSHLFTFFFPECFESHFWLVHQWETDGLFLFLFFNDITRAQFLPVRLSWLYNLTIHSCGYVTQAVLGNKSRWSDRSQVIETKPALCLTNHTVHIMFLSLFVSTSFLAWFLFLCSLVLPVDLGGWQSHPVQPDRLLETELPSSLRWTHRHTRRHDSTNTHRSTYTTAPQITVHIQRQWERGFFILTWDKSTLHCNASQLDHMVS